MTPNTKITPETVRVPFSATNDMIQRINAWADDPSMDGGAIYDAIIGHYAAPYSHSPAASSPSAVGVGSVDDLAQEIRRVDGSNILGAGALAEALWPSLQATPTPAPSAGDATEKVDWERVGPKLVEESAAIMKMVRKFVHDLPDSVCDGYAHNLDPLIEAIDNADSLRAALAAAQPQSNGDDR